MITEGKMQVKLETAQDHLGYVWGALAKAGLARNPDRAPASTDGYAPGSAAYHLAAVEQYLFTVVQAMHEQWGDTGGQLCPYIDCAHDLAFTRDGWWRCPVCQRDFYAQDSDSDIEDYHNHRDGEYTENYPAKPEIIPLARDLGPSWGAPEQSTNDHPR